MVIAIIGVLSAILVPSYLQYIESTKLNADKSDAKNMNSILQNYFSEGNSLNVDADRIRTIINENGGEQYSFIPRTADYSFWYDRGSNEIVVDTYNSIATKVGIENDNSINLVLGNNLPRTLEEVVPGMMLLDTEGTKLGKAIYSIRNLVSPFEFNLNVEKLASLNFLGSIDDITDDTYIGFLNTNFNIDKTVYVNDFGSITTNTDGMITNVVFASNIVSIPENALHGIKKVEGIIYIPTSIKFIEENAFRDLDNTNKIALPNYDVKLEQNAFSNDILSVNPQLSSLPLMKDLNISGDVELTFAPVLNGTETTNKAIVGFKPHLRLPDGNIINSTIWRVQYSQDMISGYRVMNIKLYNDEGIVAKRTITYDTNGFDYEIKERVIGAVAYIDFDIKNIIRGGYETSYKIEFETGVLKSDVYFDSNNYMIVKSADDLSMTMIIPQISNPVNLKVTYDSSLNQYKMMSYCAKDTCLETDYISIGSDINGKISSIKQVDKDISVNINNVGLLSEIEGVSVVTGEKGAITYLGNEFIAFKKILPTGTGNPTYKLGNTIVTSSPASIGNYSISYNDTGITSIVINDKVVGFNNSILTGYDEEVFKKIVNPKTGSISIIRISQEINVKSVGPLVNVKIPESAFSGTGVNGIITLEESRPYYSTWDSNVWKNIYYDLNDVKSHKDFTYTRS